MRVVSRPILPVVPQLGYVPAEARSVKPMPAWVKDLVPKPEGKNETVKSGNEDVERDTMPLIKSKIYRTLYHTEKLAKKLKGASLTATCRNDWNFVFNYIKYQLDEDGKEQVRSPRRLIYEGKGDCDCFTVTLSSLLINQKIPHFLRIMRESGSSGWSHIYIVVPKDGNINKPLAGRSDYIVMDCVTHKFDFEATFTAKKDFPMALQYLDGVGRKSKKASTKKTSSLRGVQCESKPPIANRLRRYVFTSQVLEQGMVPTEQFLKDNNIAYKPQVDDKTDSGYFLVTTSTGMKRVPTIITKQQASDLLSNAPSGTSSSSPAQNDIPVQSAVANSGSGLPTAQASAAGFKINPWLIVAALGLVVFSSGGGGGKLSGLKSKTKMATLKI